jgi:hypothetical protein
VLVGVRSTLQGTPGPSVNDVVIALEGELSQGLFSNPQEQFVQSFVRRSTIQFLWTPKSNNVCSSVEVAIGSECAVVCCFPGGVDQE